MDNSESDARLRAWEARQPEHERNDPIWGLLAYRLGRFLLDEAQRDTRRLTPARRQRTADQLLSSIASISANFAEGYSRPTAADRARFFAYALGSAREAASWYAALHDELGESVVQVRLADVSRVRRLVYGALKAVQRQTGRVTFTP